MGKKNKNRTSEKIKRTCKRRVRSRIELLERTVKNCRLCGLADVRHEVAFGEGAIPADVAFVGIAPGRSEDMMGRVWIGRAGKLLRKTIALLQTEVGMFTWYGMNLVCCYPADEISAAFRDPTEEEIGTCFPRLVEQLEIVNPNVIICLGKLPYRILKRKYPGAKPCAHPSYLLRKGGEAMKGSFYLQWYRQLEESLKEVGDE